MIDKIKNLFNLYFSFAKIGTFTIGGGLAMMPMMQSELIETRKWITDEELIDYYAVGQSTPGIVAVNVATFVGLASAPHRPSGGCTNPGMLPEPLQEQWP